MFRCLNAVSVCTSEGQYYCKCHLFSGCENYVGYRGHCFVCWIRDPYCSHDFEEIKYKPVKHFKLLGGLFKDIKLFCDFDKSLNFWLEEFEYKWRGISLVVMGGLYLKDCDYFQFFSEYMSKRYENFHPRKSFLSMSVLNAPC